MTSNKAKPHNSIGFGFEPSDSQLHFLVDIPKNKTKDVRIYECSKWDEESPKIDHRYDKLKVQISIGKWDKIKDTIRNEFNPRLRQKKYKSGRWSSKTAVHRLLGKELVLLAWVIADCDPSVIDTALKNWLGLRPEERWWLYTMTNASSGGVDDNFGWRKAIRYALTENPVLDGKRRESIFFHVNDDEI